MLIFIEIKVTQKQKKDLDPLIGEFLDCAEQIKGISDLKLRHPV